MRLFFDHQMKKHARNSRDRKVEKNKTIVLDSLKSCIGALENPCVLTKNHGIAKAPRACSAGSREGCLPSA